MTTTVTRPVARTRPATRPATRPVVRTTPAATRRARSADRPHRAARLGLAGLVGTLALSVPAVALLDGVGPRSSSLDVVASFLIVAAAEVVVARELWTLTRDRSRPAAWAALLARTGYALLLAVGALVLLADGDTGAGAFRDHWGTALGVLGLHLVAVAVAVRHAGLAARAGAGAVGLCGAGALGAALLPVDGLALTWVLAPALAGEVALAVLLARAAMRRGPATARAPRG